MQVGTPGSTGHPALPFEIQRVCGSRIENTFSSWGIVSPLSRRRSVWSIWRTACDRKLLISVIVQAVAPFAASAGTPPRPRQRITREPEAAPGRPRIQGARPNGSLRAPSIAGHLKGKPQRGKVLDLRAGTRSGPWVRIANTGLQEGRTALRLTLGQSWAWLRLPRRTKPGTASTIVSLSGVAMSPITVT